MMKFEVIYTMPGSMYNGLTFTVYDVEKTEEGALNFLLFREGMWIYEPASNFIPLPK